MNHKNSKLIVDGNSLYEIDLECLNKRARGESCIPEVKRRGFANQSDWSNTKGKKKPGI